MKPPVLNFQVQETTMENGVTQSELSMLDECAMKWNLRYNNLLQKNDEFQWNLWIGTAWHKFQEVWRKTKGNCDLTKCYGEPIPKDQVRDSDFEATLEYWMSVLPAYQETYAKLYREEATHEWSIVEKELSFEHLGIRIRGMIDLASDKPRFIRDFKTTSSAWLISPDGWDYKLQFMTYCWLMARNFPKEWGNAAFDFQLDMMQKPALKQTKADGTWQGHIRRVCADIKVRPEFYLTRKPERIEQSRINRFEEFVLTPKIQRLVLAYENPEEAISIVTNPNTNACNAFGNRCEFYDHCAKGWSVAQFFFHQRGVKHSEL